ncbi:MAG TPA: glycoside hydrolase family 76 protein [Verrucomicrobiales bacterium]|nr:glycoside hydrolase family 76 protein [Verrucomicrobiales bacterium]
MHASISRRSVCLLLASALTLRRPAFADDAPDLSPAAVKARITNGLALLDKLYWVPVLHLWFRKPGDQLRTYYEGRLNPPWWSSANAVELILDAMRITGDKSQLPALAAMWEQHHTNADQAPVTIAELKRLQQWTEADETERQRKPRTRTTTRPGYKEFNNEYLDDSGWWGLSWLKMYDFTKEAKCLATSKEVHAHMAAHWRTDAGGGVLWHIEDKRPASNAITNSLFLILSARLYERTQDQAFLKWAQQTYEWFQKNALYDGTAIVDAPGHKNDHWTYNQGAWIGGLTAFYLATGTQSYLDEAVKVADSLIRHAGLFQNGVLVEKLGTRGWDVGLFKGVCMRYLGQLRDVLREQKLHAPVADEIDTNLRSSAVSMIANADKDGQYGLQWHKDAKDQDYNFNTHTSGLIAIVALLPVPQEKPH